MVPADSVYVFLSQTPPFTGLDPLELFLILVALIVTCMGIIGDLAAHLFKIDSGIGRLVIRLIFSTALVILLLSVVGVACSTAAMLNPEQEIEPGATPSVTEEPTIIPTPTHQQPPTPPPPPTSIPTTTPSSMPATTSLWCTNGIGPYPCDLVVEERTEEHNVCTIAREVYGERANEDIIAHCEMICQENYDFLKERFEREIPLQDRANWDNNPCHYVRPNDILRIPDPARYSR